MSRPPRPGDHADVVFHPPLLLGANIGAGFVLRRAVAPLRFLPSGWIWLIGPILVALSFASFAWAVRSMHAGGGSVPTNTPTGAIVVRGPYRISRNPIYLCMLGLQIGIGIWADSLWFLLLAGAFFFLIGWGVIDREERYLERKFGDAYLSYKARVRRWL